LQQKELQKQNKIIIIWNSYLKTQSKKSKGRRLQKWVREQLIEKLNIHEEDIESRSMGAGGEDLIMARAAREKFPYSIECKNQEKLNIWESYKQASDNAGKYEPIVVIKRNNQKPLVLIDAEYFVRLHNGH
jgi:signal recognition particle subunit SEC65